MKDVNVDEAYQNLANEIIICAANDYRQALKGLIKNPGNRNYQQDARKLEDFFHSQWYEMLTDIDGDYLIKKLREEQEGEEGL